ncbi:A/G-specific adenine glycosylase [Shimazuella sp. AN120528]|uniref:A/G-specific adenine glycosylase n=1 Tax=Shimazuella soli TaxID=1892854 RepID=UPI001F0E1423|nr:A/G-specific adenine glycosylase [Shimazuella soli]MCH5586588.1 A/G-specific adenine glycosylase [Shimazuella soli]
MEIIQQDIPHIQNSLLGWYNANKRDLPWRRHSNAYYTLVSEIMLQQTKVATVIPYFERFISRFPTVYDLAAANDDEVVKLWEGLGYYSRARNLHAAVKEVVAIYGGQIPNRKTEISKLKGIGPYTTGAVLSIAYNQKVPAVDGNVMRVFSRIFALEDDIAKPATRKKMEEVAELLIPDHSPGDFNQALMELGATVCTPKSPQCLFCPVNDSCLAYEKGLEKVLPIKKKARAPEKISIMMYAVTFNRKLLVVKRPASGLLANMWSLPTEDRMEEMPHLQQVEEYCEINGYSAKISKDIYYFDHIFSHRHWKIVLIPIELDQPPEFLPKRSIWVEQHAISDFAFPKVYLKALEQLGYRN